MIFLWKNVYFTETEISLWEMKVWESHAYCHFHKLKRPAKGALEVDPAAIINRIYCSGNHPLLYNTKSITLWQEQYLLYLSINLHVSANTIYTLHHRGFLWQYFCRFFFFLRKNLQPGTKSSQLLIILIFCPRFWVVSSPKECTRQSNFW